MTPPSPSLSPSLPAPHSMCSPLECNDRQSHMELHVFESSDATYKLNPRSRTADPRLAVKKYRRSAAGGGVRTYDDEGRTLKDLEVTVEYLLGILLPRQRTFGREIMPPRSLSETAAFVDDRVRAVQVDLTTLLGEDLWRNRHLSGGSRSALEWARVRKLQARLVRYGILMQHLLSDLPARKYEAKFGWTALRTALGAYFDAWDAVKVEYCVDEEDLTELDEISSYSALLHLSSVLRSRESSVPAPPAGLGYIDENGSGMGALSAKRFHRRLSLRPRPDEEEEKKSGASHGNSRWMWALHVASAADAGNYVRMLCLLCDGDNDGADDPKQTNGRVAELQRWRILSRCCIVPSLNTIRINMVRQYNKSLGKNEKVPAADLASLLRLPSTEDATDFCKSIGLPAAFSSSAEGGLEDHVVMKAAPISVTDSEAIRRMGRPGREEDFFVFGAEGRRSWDKEDWMDKGGGTKKEEKKKRQEKKEEEEEEKAKNRTAGMSSLQLALMRMKVSEAPAPAPSAAPDNWEDRKDDDFGDVEGVEKKEDDGEADLERKARVDADGVAVPPGRVLRDLVR